MLKKKSVMIVMIAIVAIGALILFKQPEDTNQNVIKIGVVLPLTGNVASYGNDAKDGIDLAVDLINNKQTKHKFIVEYHDSKGEAQTAVTVLNHLLSISKPNAVIGEITSSATASMIPIIDRNKTILISPTASAPHLSQKSPYFFRVYPSDIEEGYFMAKTVAQRHPNANVCIVYANNDFGVGLKNVFENYAETVGINILQSFGYSTDNMDFRAMLTTIRSRNPDAIYMPGYHKDGALILRQMREIGINVPVYGSTTHEDPQLIESAGIASEGFMYPVSTGFNAESDDFVVTSFINNFVSKYDKAPGLVAALAYDCAQLIIEGVLTKGVSADNIKQYILTTKDIQGAAGMMNFDLKGDVHKPIILRTIKNGKFQEVL